MTDRVLLGRDNAGNYGFKVSKSGVDVKSATDLQLLINYGAAHGQALQSGRATILNGNSSVNVSVSGLGSSPPFVLLAYWDGSADNYPAVKSAPSLLTVDFDGSTMTISRGGTSGDEPYDYVVMSS